MIPLPLFLEMENAVICHCQSIWCCKRCDKRKVNEASSICVAKSKVEFFFVLFLQDSSTHSTQLPIFSCLKEPNKVKNEVWFFVFSWSCLELSRYFSIIKVNAGLLLVLKFCLFVQGIQVLIMCYCTLQPFKTSRNASKDNCLAFPWQNRSCCVEIRNVR
jgi:hypothetical protein